MLPEKFVCASDECASYTNMVPAPIFRKSFCVKSTDNATLTIGCTGFYELYLNGVRITDGYLKPYISNPNEVIFYNNYDLGKKLVVGENVLCVILGNGYANPIGGEIWQHGKNHKKAPAFALECIYDDTSFDAEDMLWNRSHILFDDYRCGTYCDMTLFEKEWYLGGFDDSNWNVPLVCDYSHSQKKMAECQSIKEIRRIEPLEYYSGALREYRMRDAFAQTLYNGDTPLGKTPLNGGYIYDFGENCAGVPCLKIKGTKGQKIEMQFSELLFEGFVDYINVDVYPDGCCQKDVYVCSGDGVEEYIPPFTYHGFRYCYVYGITEEQATQDLLTYIVLHNDVKKKTGFMCSDEISNRIFDACIRSDLSNLFYIITDCPAREKNGWTGDAAVSAEHYMLHYDCEDVFSDLMYCMRFSQGKSGAMPLFVPSAGSLSDCIVWDSALFALPYYAYKYAGNTKIIIDNAHVMMENLRHHISILDERGILDSGLGDWLPVDSQPDEYASPLGFCASCVLLLCLRMSMVMFDAVGMTENSNFAKEHYAKLRESIRMEYNDGGVITKGKTEKYIKPTYRVCQTSQALGLYADIFDREEIPKAVSTLLELVEQNKGSFDCGFLGLRVIFLVLSKYGYSDIAYKMITKPSHPSYANMIYRGETTVWERFQPPGKRIGSHNHHFMGDVSAWYVKTVAGINVNPNCDNPDKILVNPHFVKDLNNACGEYASKDGFVKVDWARKDGKIYVDIYARGSFETILGDNLKKDSCVVNFFKE